MPELLDRVVAHPLVVATGVGLAAIVLGLWLAVCWWVYFDAKRRTESWPVPYLAAVWIFLSGPLLLPVSAAIYALVRPQELAADRRTRLMIAALERAAQAEMRCPACSGAVHEAWIRCPACGTQLANPCPQCGRVAPLEAELCPWCAWTPGDAILAGGVRVTVEPVVATTELGLIAFAGIDVRHTRVEPPRQGPSTQPSPAAGMPARAG